jgi:hypothetical protein
MSSIFVGLVFIGFAAFFIGEKFAAAPRDESASRIAGELPGESASEE